MVGVVFVFVREDAGDVEALAEAFDSEGYGIEGRADADDALHVIVWSRAARRSEAFLAAAERAARSGRSVVACLSPPPEGAFRTPVVDLSTWDGADADALAPLFDAVLDVLRPVRASVIGLPARSDIIEVAFTEAASGRDERVRRAWEAPIPAQMLRPVQEREPEPKLGASAPRRDFRKIRRRGDHSRAHAALMFAIVTLTAGSLLITTVQGLAARPHAEARVEAVDTGGMSLSSASADAVGLEDIVPEERDRLFEPQQQIGRHGVEPPSARTVRQARYEQ
jgi:hypothetical protein